MKKVVGKRRGEILIKCALAAAVGLLLIMLVQSFLENPAEVNAAEPEITLYSKDNKVRCIRRGKKKRGSWKSRIIRSRIFWGHGFSRKWETAAKNGPL